MIGLLSTFNKGGRYEATSGFYGAVLRLWGFSKFVRSGRTRVAHEPGFVRPAAIDRYNP
jgi:hypothetical protein